MSEDAKMSLTASTTSRAGLKRKRKNSESAPRSGLNPPIAIPNESRYCTRAKKSDSNTNVPAKRSRKQNSKTVKTEKPAPTTMVLTDLPNEILGNIMSFVSFDDLFNLERVNRRIRSVVRLTLSKKHTLDHEAIIKHTDFPRISLAEERLRFRFNHRRVYFRRHHITNKSVKTIFARANITHLDLSVYYSTLTYQISSLFSMAPELTTLNLSSIRLTNNSLRTIARYCPLLEEVCFEQCFSDGKIEQGLEALFTKCPKIVYLNLAENNKLYGDSFAYIPTQLLYLNLANCYNLNANAIGLIADRAKNLETLILENYDNAAVANFNVWLGKLTKLRYLEVSNIFMGQDYPYLDFSNMEDLEMLCLRYNTLVKLDSLRSLQYCSKLRALDLRFSHQFDNSAFDLLKKCKGLRHCNLSNWPNLNHEQFADFVKHSKLQYLAINDSRDIDAEVVKAVITECTSLTHLEILGLSVDYHALLSLALVEQCPQRGDNILKLAVPQAKPPCVLPSSKWCEVIPCESYGPSPFARFTNVRNQFHNQ